MAVSTDVTNDNSLTHTEKIAREDPEAVRTVAERSREKGRDMMADALFDVLDSVEN